MRFLRGCIDLTVDIVRAVGQAIWHEGSCDSLVDSAWHCNCKRSKR